MKRLKLLFFGLCFVFGVNMAQECEYHQNDLDCLLKFMWKNTSDKYGGRLRATNAQLLLGDTYTDEWHTNTDWLRYLHQEGNVTWKSVENEEGVISQRIESIFFTGTKKSGIYLSGELNFSNCTSLVSVQSCDEKFTAVNLDGCENLRIVFLDRNLIKRASFENCYQINQILLDGNQLMPSEVKLAKIPEEKFLFNNQTAAKFDYTTVLENGELYMKVDLSAQLDNELLSQYFYRSFMCEGIEYESTGDGIFYFAVDDVLKSNSLIQIQIAYQGENIDAFHGTVEFEDLFNSLWPIEIATNQMNPGTVEAFIYWVEDDEYYLIDKVKNSGSTFIKTKYLPAGEYIVLVDAEGYLCNYYSDIDSPVRSWKDERIKKVFPGDNITVMLEQKRSLKNDGVTIDGVLKDGKTKASARVLQRTTVTLHSSTANSEWDWVATTQTNEKDAYSFSNLPTGTYRVSVEMPGYEAGSVFVLANTVGTNYENQNFIVHEASKTIKANGDFVSYLLKEEIQLSVYPNPVTDMVRIAGLEGACTVKIINMMGQVVKLATGNSPELTLHLNDLSSGMYLLRIESQERARTVKIIKN